MFQDNRLIKYFFIVLFILIMFNPAYASESWLYSIEGLKSPHKVAVAPNGDIFVTEPTWNRIKVFDHNGNYKRRYSIQHPSVLAVDSTGLIYIGIGKYSSNTPPYDTPGEVMVYDRDFNYIRSLGTGAGEFVNPTDIFTDNRGRIYVTDSEADNVKIFNPDGTLALSFGEYGIGDGYFNIPLSVAVDETTGEIYVSDKQLVPNSSGGYVGGARIQVYSATGNFIRGFGDYSLGQLISPSDIALYNGRLYVTDSYQNVLQVYDASSGLYLYVLQAPDDLLRLPVSLDISSDGLMYVVSRNTDRIYVLGIDNYVNFEVAPKTLSFEAVAGGEPPPAQYITITNTGAGELNWTAVLEEEWIFIGPTAGTISAGLQETLAIGVDPSTLEPGDYKGSLSITSTGGTEEAISISLLVKEPPVLSVTPQDLSFTAEVGNNPPSQGLQITLSNASGNSFWTANSDASWLGINPVQAGAGTTDAIVNVNSASLSAGDYTGHITIESQGAVNSPVLINVTLTVMNSGTITVTTNHSDATFTIAGDNSIIYEGSGTDWSVTGVPDGTYTIVFGAITGYTTAASDTQTLAGGGTLAFQGNYIEIRPLSIVATMDKGGKSLTTIKILDMYGNQQHAFTVFGDISSGLDTAVADINGDGANEIIAGTHDEASIIGIYSADGVEITSFMPFTTEEGVKVEASDLDGDGTAEIIVVDRENSEVRVFEYNGNIIDTGIMFTNPVLPNRIIALNAGDVDSDGEKEIVLIAYDKKRGSYLNILTVDTSGGTGNWTLVLDKHINLGKDKIIDIAVADADGDGFNEIFIASSSAVFILTGDGTYTGTVLSAEDITSIGIADLDADGNIEIVAGMGEGKVQVFTLDGKAISGFTPLDSKHLTGFTAYKSKSGVRVSAGDLGY